MKLLSSRTVRTIPSYLIALVFLASSETFAQHRPRELIPSPVDSATVPQEVLIITWGMVGATLGVGSGLLLFTTGAGFLGPVLVTAGAAAGVSLSASKFDLPPATGAAFLGAAAGTASAIAVMVKDDDLRYWPLLIVLPATAAWIGNLFGRR